MADFDLDVTEVTDYARHLDGLSNRGARSFIGIGVKYRQLMMDEARRVVPVRSGDLQRSIGPEKTEASRTGYNANWIVGEGYAGFVEFGTSRMAARPFVRPAIKKHRRGYIEELANAARDAGLTKGGVRGALRGVAQFGSS